MKLNAGAHIHLMGICGTAMASLAGLLQDKGFQVSGSDVNFYPPMSTQLEKLKIKIMTGYKAENLQAKPDMVIVGNVISRDNPEVQELMRLNIPYMSLPKAMSEFLIEDRNSVVIAGTHGKTTTTSLAAWVAERSNLKPGFLVGGIPKNYGQSFRVPTGDWFVIEGDEYDTAFFDKVPKFIHYKPKYVILTSIEFDHADIYKNLDEVKEAFIRLLKLIPEDGLLIYQAEDKNIESILSHCRAKKVSYGKEEGAGTRILKAAPIREGLEFTLSRHGVETSYFLPMFGEYNAQNGAAVVTLAQELKWDVDLGAAFKEFRGVKRRQEIIGQPRDIMIIEDFAHHPTAVEETIRTFKKRPQSGKVHAVFEPRSATSRRNIFQEDYLKAFKNADQSYIAAPFAQEKIPVDQRFSSEKLVGDLNKAQPGSGHLCQGVNEIVAELKKNTHPGDTILVMSNGGFDGIYEKLLAALA
jgi:UDP-N-acetylmuramate: L-alanyl-gamma-D-glutamyl-meso-diaminopimelate ligase